jgi:Periplasmic binding protein
VTKRSLSAGLAVALILSACTGDGSGEEAGPERSPVPEVSNPLGECARNTKIGVVYDEATQSNFANGLNLAADQLNQRGSFNYEPLLAVVSGVEAAGVAGPVEEMGGREDISAIVSSARAEGAEASADAARDAGIALLLVGASSDEAKLGDGVFSLRFSTKGEVDALKAAARSDLRFEDPQVIGFPGLVDRNGEYIVAPGPGQDPGPLMRGVTELTGPESVVGTSVYALTDTGEIPDGVHVGVPWYVDAPESINAGFVLDYEEAYGEKPTIDAAYGYTSVLLIARGVEGACSNERADVIEGLGKTKDASSVFGRFSFTKKGEPKHQVWLLEVKNGTPTPP